MCMLCADCSAARRRGVGVMEWPRVNKSRWNEEGYDEYLCQGLVCVCVLICKGLRVITMDLIWAIGFFLG